MSRAVYIGGFGNGKKAAAGVAEALSEYYDEVDPFTFSRAMAKQDSIRRAVQGVDVFTHSAGMLAIEGMRPNRIEAFGAPLPATKRALIGRTVVKTARMHTSGIGIHAPSDVLAVGAYDLSTTAELTAHPVSNLGRLGQIAGFNAIEAAIAAKQSDIPTALTYTNGDEYFTLTARQETVATAAAIDVTRVPGIHDELIIRPVVTLQRAGVMQRL